MTFQLEDITMKLRVIATLCLTLSLGVLLTPAREKK